eukprot:3801436-Rhodomonas_salina.5
MAAMLTQTASVAAVIEHTLDKKPEKRIEIVEDFQVRAEPFSLRFRAAKSNTRTCGPRAECSTNGFSLTSVER